MITMITKNQINEREQLEILTIEQFVPKNPLVRKLDAAYKTPAITTSC